MIPSTRTGRNTRLCFSRFLFLLVMPCWSAQGFSLCSIGRRPTSHILTALHAVADPYRDDEDEDNTLLRASAVLHKTPLMIQLAEIEKDMKQNHEDAEKIMDLLRRDVETQRIMRKQTALAMERLHSVKGDMILQLNQARIRYENDIRAIKEIHDAELAEKDAIIEKLESERASIRQTGQRLLHLIRTAVVKKVGGWGGRFHRRQER